MIEHTRVATFGQGARGNCLH